MSGRVAARRRRDVLAHPVAFGLGAPAMTILGAVTTVLAPALLGPEAFGSFATASMAFQAVSATDLGMAQLADRRIAAVGADDGGAILSARCAVAVAVAVTALPTAWLAGDAATVLAVAGGTAFMLANGPVTILRASGRRGPFTAVALALQAGMTLPRLLGLVIGGATGSFALLLAWSGAVAAWSGAFRRFRATSALPLILAALPLFAFNASWTVFLITGRAVAGLVSDPAEFGRYAFGANLLALAAAVVGNVAQARYPSLASDLSRPERRGCARRAVEGDVLRLSCAVAVGAASALALARPALDALLPAYAPAAAAVAALAVGAVPIAAVAWTLPLAIATSARPWRDSLATFAPPFAVLVPATALGHRYAGIEGEAWATTGGALVLLLAVLALLGRVGAISKAGARRMGLLQAAIAIGLTASACSMGPTPAPAEPRGPLVFEDRFDPLRLWDGRSGTWEARYPWGDHTNASNAERQYYVDPAARDGERGRGPTPFGSGPAGLTITARRAPTDPGPSPGGLDYTSGILTTAPSFGFTYGTVEVEAKVPRGKGLWPAVWLLPRSGRWPPEIDVVEVHGDRPRGYWASMHTGAGSRPAVEHRIATSDLSRAFHVYGVSWGPREIAWTFDGREVARSATPADMHEPMCLVIDLAVGGRWPGDPDDATPFPSTLAVRRISVYRPPGPRP